MTDNTLRIIDANLNRTGEGLRILEEIARLLLDDATLTRQLKIMRHGLLREDISFQQQLLRARDAAADIGADMDIRDEDATRTLPTTVIANSRRVQESLRTLEELTKLPDTPRELNPVKFQQARFDLYTIEQKLVAGLLRRDKLQRLHGLYVIIDTAALKGRSHVETARYAVRGGARVVQLRDKTTSRRNLLDIAGQLRKLCTDENVLFIVNDHLDVALESDADGLHVGQSDLPVKAARRWLPPDKVLGGSVETVEQALAAQAGGADYLGVAAIYPTTSRADTGVVGLDGLSRIKQAVSLPLVALGGINHDNATEAIEAGAVAVAVISAVAGAESPEDAARQIADRLEANNERTNRQS